MTADPQWGLDELADGYQALAEVIVTPEVPELGYAHGYLDGWADAMWHASMTAEGKRPKPGKAFPLLAAKSLRSAARAALRLKRR